MSVVSIGTDLVEIARLQGSLERFGRRFGERILGPDELPEWLASGAQARFLAKRFAAKEAAAKALGTGFREGVSWVEIQVRHDELGRPLLAFSGMAARRMAMLGASRGELSISDERQYALAFVVLLA